MRLILLTLVSSLASADAPADLQVPRSAPPKVLQFKVPRIPWWNSAEKTRVASPFAFHPFQAPMGGLKPDLLLSHPHQAPAKARAYFFLQ